MFAPERIRVPAPVLVSAPAPEISPDRLSVVASEVETVLLPDRATARLEAKVPVVASVAPANARSPVPRLASADTSRTPPETAVPPV